MSIVYQRGGRSVTATVDNRRALREADDAVAVAGDAILGTATAPSGSEVVGDRWLVIATATGDFATREGLIATRLSGGWAFRDAIPGERFSIVATRQVVFYDATLVTLRPLNAPHDSSEWDTGELGPSGGRIWRKRIALGTMPNATTASTAHGITSFPTGTTAHSFIRLGRMSDGTTVYPIPSTAAGAARNIVEVRVTATNVVVQTNFNATAYTGTVELEYER